MKRLVGVLTLALLCNSALAANDVSAAKAAALKWLSQLDAGHYKTAWKEASPLFRQRVAESKWVDAASRVMGSLGKLESRHFKRATPKEHLPGVPDGHYMVIQFSSKFANKSKAIETVTPMLTGGVWKVSGYYVR